MPQPLSLLPCTMTSIGMALCLCGGEARAQGETQAPRASLAELQTPLPAFDTAPLTAMAEQLAPEIARGIDTTIARAITATGSYTGLSVESWQKANQAQLTARQALEISALSRKVGGQYPGALYADPGVSWSQLGKQSFGAPDALAVGLQQRFADARTLATQVSLRHASGPIDLHVDVKGAKPLASDNPLRLSYDSAAFLALNPALQLGMVARGDLGTLSDFAPHARHDAGALARLKLLEGGGTLSAETGYDLRLGNGSQTTPPRVHMSLNFNWKL